MKKTFIAFLAVTIALVVLGYAFWDKLFPGMKVVPAQTNDGGSSVTQNISIEEYVRENISDLSAEKEVLGGTFYVTEIEAHGGAGTVSYEDGHVAYTADFTYDTDASGKVTVTSFTIRK